MEIHKPKAAHSWREFLTEIGIIVVGVLIALGAEQAVENLRWQDKVERAETNLNLDLTAIYVDATERRLVEGCLDRRLTQLRSALLSRDGEWTPLQPLSTPFSGEMAYVTPTRSWVTRRWSSYMTDGTAAHFPPDLRAMYDGIYSQVEGAQSTNDAEMNEAGRLSILQQQTSFSRAERNELAAQIGQEALRNHLMALASGQIMDRLRSIKRVDEASALRRALVVSNTYRGCAALSLLQPGAPAPLPPFQGPPRILKPLVTDAERVKGG